MNILTLFYLSIIPVILIGIYLYKKDKNKEPFNLLIKLFFSGFLSCILVIIISVFLSIFPIFSIDAKDLNFYEKVINVFIGVAFVEEICKWFMVYKISYKHKEFDELYDMILYATFVSLGFACLENIFYVFEGGTSVGIVRAIFAIPGHTWDAVFMGYFLGIAKIASINERKDLEKRNIIYSILIPTILHGIYDFCLEYESIYFVIIFFVFVIVMYVKSIKKVKLVSKLNKKIYESKYCSNCGNKVYGNYCSNCGNKLS